MAKPKKELTAAQRREKKRRRKETMIIFINGRQKRVPRPPKFDDYPLEEIFHRSADPLWFHQNEKWEAIDPLD